MREKWPSTARRYVGRHDERGLTRSGPNYSAIKSGIIRPNPRALLGSGPKITDRDKYGRILFVSNIVIHRELVGVRLRRGYGATSAVAAVPFSNVVVHRELVRMRP